MAGRRAAVFIAAALAGGCSVLTSLDGFSPHEAGVDSSLPDSATDVAAIDAPDAAPRPFTCAMDTAVVPPIVGGHYDGMDSLYLAPDRFVVLTTRSTGNGHVLELRPYHMVGKAPNADGVPPSVAVLGQLGATTHANGVITAYVLEDQLASNRTNLKAYVFSDTSLTLSSTSVVAFFPLVSGPHSVAAVVTPTGDLLAVNQTESGVGKVYRALAGGPITVLDSVPGMDLSFRSRGLVMGDTRAALFYPDNPSAALAPSILVFDQGASTPRRSLLDQGMWHLIMAGERAPQGVDVAFGVVSMNVDSFVLRFGQVTPAALETIDAPTIDKLTEYQWGDLGDIPLDKLTSRWETGGTSDVLAMVGGSLKGDGLNVTWIDLSGQLRGANSPGVRLLPHTTIERMAVLPPYNPLPFDDRMPFTWAESPADGGPDQSLYVSQIICKQ